MTDELAGQPFYFEDHVLGARHPAGAHAVTASAIIEFASLWDPQPWHIDEAAAKESLFGGLTACSAHIFAMFCNTSQRWQSGVEQQAVAGLGFDDMRMHSPVFAGDTLDCVTVVDDLRLSNSRPDCGIVTYRSELLNQRGELVFSIKAATLVARNPGVA